jgi:hypothetical protein
VVRYKRNEVHGLYLGRLLLPFKDQTGINLTGSQRRPSVARLRKEKGLLTQFVFQLWFPPLRPR